MGPVESCSKPSDSTHSIIFLFFVAGGRSCIKTLEGHEASILRLQFVARGQQIISAASDGLLKVRSSFV